MSISIYTFVNNGIFYDYHVCDMLKHHLDLADEIIVNEGFSTDGTYERIRSIDPKIKITRSNWGRADDFAWFLRFKNEARERCTKDWCILLDCDEFIPEAEFDRIRNYLDNTSEEFGRLNLVNFYGNYRVYHRCPEKVNWPSRKLVIHRNSPDMEVIGDGSNVRRKGARAAAPSSIGEFACHHFGFVRNPARLRQKWRDIFGSMYLGKKRGFSMPSFLFDLWPHDWLDPHFLPDLATYDGPLIRAVRENPEEFVRDNFLIYNTINENKF